MFSDVRCGCIRCHVFQWMGIAGRMDRMGKTTFNRLPGRLYCGFYCFPMAGPKTHDIFHGFGGRRVMSLINFSVSMSLRLPKAMVRQHREPLYSSRPPARSASDSERPLLDVESQPL